MIEHLVVVTPGFLEGIGERAVSVGPPRPGDTRTEGENRLGQPARIDGRQLQGRTTGAARRRPKSGRRARRAPRGVEPFLPIFPARAEGGGGGADPDDGRGGAFGEDHTDPRAQRTLAGLVVHVIGVATLRCANPAATGQQPPQSLPRAGLRTLRLIPPVFQSAPHRSPLPGRAKWPNDPATRTHAPVQRIETINRPEVHLAPRAVPSVATLNSASRVGAARGSSSSH